MSRPLMNRDDVPFDDIEDDGLYPSRRGRIGDPLGARHLGDPQAVLPPGQAPCPFHGHHGEEAMFLVLAGEGEGALRFGDRRSPIRRRYGAGRPGPCAPCARADR